jgi:hypothetical protein
LAQTTSLALFCLILAWAALPLGSNRPWSWSLLVLAIAALGVLVALDAIVRRQPLRPPPMVGLAGLAYLGTAVWAFLQMQPAPVADWAHPAWAALVPFSIDAPNGIGAVTLDIDLTRDALMRLLGYIAAFVVAYVLAREAEAARKLMLVILCTTTLVSAYGLFMVFDGNELLPFLANAAYRGVVTGSFVNRNSFATYANLGVVIGFVWLFEPLLRDLDRRELNVLLRELLQRLIGERGLFLVALLILATASLLTASRGGFLSIAAGLLAILCRSSSSSCSPGRACRPWLLRPRSSPPPSGAWSASVVLPCSSGSSKPRMRASPSGR